MSSLTLELPETLHRQLETLARNEGVSLAQYVMYALTRQASFAYQVQAVSPEIQQQEREEFARLLASLRGGSEEEVDQILAEREPSEPESALPPDVIARLRARMQSKGTDARGD